MVTREKTDTLSCIVLHQHVPCGAPLDEQDVLAEAASVATALRQAGMDATILPITMDLAATAAALRDARPDIVFNLVESLGGGGPMAIAAPALLHQLGLPHTGNGFAAMALTGDKPATRRVLRAAGIPVPPGPEDGWRGPFIVKHATEHASFGLGAHSVVDSLPDRVPNGWFAEAYIDGREITVALLDDGAGGVTALPAAELVFDDWPTDMPRILDYAGKWQTDHPIYARTWRGFDVEPDLAAQLRRIARRCWDVLGLTGYARVDFRIAPDGRVYIIDVNTNPCLHEDAGFAAAAEQAGFHYGSIIERIARAALRQPAIAAPPAPPRTPRDWTLVALRQDLRTDDDIGGLCRATGFFTDAEVDIAEELARDRRQRGAASDYRFLLADDAAGLVGYACYGPTAGTEGAWDLYWIVVHPRAQGSGVGRVLADAVTAEMAAHGGTQLYAETASKPLYAPTRAFYAASGFVLQAVVPDFYAPGDAKQIWVRGAIDSAGGAGRTAGRDPARIASPAVAVAAHH